VASNQLLMCIHFVGLGIVISDHNGQLAIVIRGGFGSGGSGFGEIRCPSVENKFMDNPSANRPLIGSGERVG
jgi:hypothetical protein